MPDHDPVYKVTIIPRGRALGVTMFLPEEDRYSYSKQRLMSQMKSLTAAGWPRSSYSVRHMSRRAPQTTSSARRISRATWSRSGACRIGSGPLTYTEDDGEIFLGRSVTRHKQVSDVTAHAIDEEVRQLDRHLLQRGEAILENNREKLDKMAAALMKYETIDERQISDIMDGREPRPPADWDEPSEPGKAMQHEVADEKGAAPFGGPAGQH